MNVALMHECLSHDWSQVLEKKARHERLLRSIAQAPKEAPHLAPVSHDAPMTNAALHVVGTANGVGDASGADANTVGDGRSSLADFHERRVLTMDIGKPHTSGSAPAAGAEENGAPAAPVGDAGQVHSLWLAACRRRKVRCEPRGMCSLGCTEPPI